MVTKRFPMTSFVFSSNLNRVDCCQQQENGYIGSQVWAISCNNFHSTDQDGQVDPIRDRNVQRRIIFAGIIIKLEP